MKNFTIAFRLFLVMTLLTGVAYPLLITGIAHTLWPKKAGGSLVIQDGEVKGSLLIAQKFESSGYFWPRPSATDYNAAASGGSNKGPSSADLKKIHDEGKSLGLPDEMIFTSGSGLDPHVSLQTVQIRMDKVASARGLNDAQREELQKLIEQHVENRDLGFLGKTRVNVLKLNLAMDNQFGLFGKKQQP